MSEVLIAIAGLGFSVFTFFCGQYTEKQKFKLELANKIDTQITEYLERVEAGTSKNILRVKYTSVSQDIFLFCRKYNIYYQKQALPLLTDLLIYTTDDDIKLKNASDVAISLKNLVLSKR